MGGGKEYDWRRVQATKMTTRVSIFGKCLLSRLFIITEYWDAKFVMNLKKTKTKTKQTKKKKNIRMLLILSSITFFVNN